MLLTIITNILTCEMFFAYLKNKQTNTPKQQQPNKTQGRALEAILISTPLCAVQNTKNP